MGQNETEQTDLRRVKNEDALKQLYIEYTAMAGLVIDEGGNVKNIRPADFAKAIGVARSTLYRWQKEIPNFWEKVNDKLPEVYGKHVRVIYKGLSLRAAKGDAQQAILLLNQVDRLRPKVEKSEVTHIIPQPILGGTAISVDKSTKELNSGV